MTTLKYKKNVKIAFATLFLALILSLEPALAARKSDPSGRRTDKSTPSSPAPAARAGVSQSTPPRGQVSRPSFAPSGKLPSITRQTATRVITSLRSSAPSTRLNISSPSVQPPRLPTRVGAAGQGSSNSPQDAFRQSIVNSFRPAPASPDAGRGGGQPGPSLGGLSARPLGTRQSGDITLSRPSSIRTGITPSDRRPSSPALPQSGNPQDGLRHDGARQPMVNSESQINSSITSRIASPITTTKPDVSDTQRAPARREPKPPAGISSNRIPVSPERDTTWDAVRSSSISTRIGSVIRMQKSSAPETQRTSLGSEGNRIGSSIGSQIGSMVRTQKPGVPSTQRPPAGSPVRRPDGSDNRISSSKSWSIGNIIGTRGTPQGGNPKPALPDAQEPSVESSGNRITSSKSLSIGSIISTRKSPADSTNLAHQRWDGARSGEDKTDITRMVENGGGLRQSRTRKSEPHREALHSPRESSLRTPGGRDGQAGKEPDKRLEGPPLGRTQISRQHKDTDLRIVARTSTGSRINKAVPERQTTFAGATVVNDVEGPRKAGTQRGERTSPHSPQDGLRHYRTGRSSGVLYRDRPHIIRHVPHYEYSYMDWHNRLCYRTVWPGYRFMVYYNLGPWFTFRYVYPYYHRKYIFVSLGGYWPIEYTYRRYYWYGCHPYIWCGYYPIAREVQGDTYNYYTYNYYYDDNNVVSGSTARCPAESQVIDDIQPVDHNTFADVREKLAKQAAEKPAPVTPADTCFEEAVKAFEADNYDVAVEKFAEAMELAPDDMVLPFAYSQALFAKEQYSEAAEVLRRTLAKVSPEKEGVFYPRGLYSDDDALFEQIDLLAEKAELYSFDADLQLLLGYQLLGVGKLDEAVVPLQQASRDMENAAAATTLLNVLEKIRATDNTD